MVYDPTVEEGELRSPRTLRRAVFYVRAAIALGLSLVVVVGLVDVVGEKRFHWRVPMVGYLKPFMTVRLFDQNYLHAGSCRLYGAVEPAGAPATNWIALDTDRYFPMNEVLQINLMLALVNEENVDGLNQAKTWEMMGRKLLRAQHRLEPRQPMKQIAYFQKWIRIEPHPQGRAVEQGPSSESITVLHAIE